MSSNEENKCNHCSEFFNPEKLPLKMSGCPHNICEGCWKELKVKKVSIIRCSFCGFKLDKISTRKLESNSLLALKIKEKNISA